ncbi:MAG TPA: substrate-binding domain-containing protein [Candidatus Dormibacteraeota bacterium]|nr:substrate-binding domain-containing protein [Candidatus Dormibacteraeota bacterium]
MRLRAWLIAAVVCAALPATAQEHLRLATTTSTENSGLLGYLLPTFEQAFNLKVDVVAVGSGQALKLAENGDADVVLSHAPSLEEPFVADGFGVNRRGVMYNDFIIVGPPADPAGIKGMRSAAEALRTLADGQATFLSRGDESGTHVKEKELWAAAGITPSGAWYRSAGVGMGQLLQMADETRGYTLTDRGTYLSRKQKGDLVILVENDKALFNPYSLIATNPARHPTAKYIAAMQLIAWMTSVEGQKKIASFQIDGKPLFVPSAVP